MFRLQNNIKIVSGAQNHCIYNLNSCKLYCLDSEHLEYLHAIIAGRADIKDVPETVIDYFINEGIVIDSEKQPVDELKEYEYRKTVDFAWIEVTQNCNLCCRHCYEGSSKAIAAPEMSMENYLTVVKELVSIGVKRVQLVGGEPLVHSRIMDMIAVAADNFEFVEVYTNGTLLSDELLEFMTQRKVALAFSLYSDDCAIHDSVTCTKGSHARTLNSIYNAVSNGNTVRVASVEMKGVPRYIFEDKRVTARSDLPRITGRAGLELYTEDMLRRKLITKDTFRKPINAYEFLKNQKIHNCFGSKLYIDCNLNVYPCVMERRISSGNIKNRALIQMVGSESVFFTKDNVDGCKDCEFRYACFDCRPDSNGGELHDKPWYCTYNPYEGKWEDEDAFIRMLLNDSKNERKEKENVRVFDGS